MDDIRHLALDLTHAPYTTLVEILTYLRERKVPYCLPPYPPADTLAQFAEKNDCEVVLPNKEN